MRIDEQLLRISKGIIYIKEKSKLYDYFKKFQLKMIENLEDLLDAEDKGEKFLISHHNLNLKDELEKRFKLGFDNLELLIIISNLE